MFTKLRDSTVKRGISEFLVHVVNSSSRLILKNNSVSLDNVEILLEDLVNGENSSLRSLNLVELSHVVPELGLSSDLISSENSHLEDFRLGISNDWESCSRDDVLSNL